MPGHLLFVAHRLQAPLPESISGIPRQGGGMDVKEPGPYSSTLHAKAAVTKATLIVAATAAVDVVL